MKKAVIVEPEIPENTGFIARLAANFNFQLRIVKPQFNLKKARKTASKAQNKIREAKIYNTTEEAVKDLEYIIGTKPGKGTPLTKFQPRKNTSIMIGKESNGLNKKQLELCDHTIHIPTENYPSINQSHAAAILFHKLNQKPENQKQGIQPKQKEKIKEITSDTLEKIILQANPSKKQAGKTIKELMKPT